MKGDRLRRGGVLPYLRGNVCGSRLRGAGQSPEIYRELREAHDRTTRCCAPVESALARLAFSSKFKVQGSKLAAAPQALVARPFVPLVASVPYLPHSFNSQQLTARAERALAEVFEVFVLYAFC